MPYGDAPAIGEVRLKKVDKLVEPPVQSEPEGFQKLETLISIVEKLPPRGYDQNMKFNRGVPAAPRLCAIGNAYRLGITKLATTEEGGRVFGLPSGAATMLFGNQQNVNALLGRWSFLRVKPKHWAKAARRVLAEQRLLRERQMGIHA